MFKLLTDQARQKVAREYALRRTIIMLCGLTLVFLMGATGLLPSYVLSTARLNEVLERARAMNNLLDGKDEPDLRAWLIETNHRLKMLSPKLDTDRPSVLLEKAISLSPKGIRLTSFLWTKTEEGANLSVAGVARDRQTLLSFQNRLNNSGYFSNATLPISNLARDKNIDFQIKFSPL